jgi:hypothetical protein
MTDGMTEANREPVRRGKTIHVCVSIEGLLSRRDRITHMLKDGRELDDGEARVELLRLFAQGVRVLPCGERCEGFSDVDGCPGHER